MLQTVIIGLDGANWPILDPILAHGYMPTLAGLIARGVRAPLRSTLPALTGPAWASLYTGKNPGKHAVGDWATLDADYRVQMAHAGQVRGPRFWDYLNAQGKTIGLIAVPMTYPPVPLQGFMVTGMGTPGPNYAWTYPPELAGELRAAFADYELDRSTTDFRPDQARAFVHRLAAHAGQVTDLAEHLLASHPVDALFLVYTATDRLQHCLIDPLLGLRDGSAWEGDDPLRDALVSFFEALDGCIARLLDLTEPVHVLIVSDHGFTRSRKVFYINDWLLESGYLSLGGGLARAGKLLDRLARHTLRRGDASGFDSTVMLGRTIDWGRTRAFSNSHNGIYVNAEGRFRRGIVRAGEYDSLCERLAGELVGVTDPDTGQPIVEEVVRRADAYHGQATASLPDLLLLFRDDAYVASRYFRPPGAGRDLFAVPTPNTVGQHHRDGIFAAAGPALVQSQVATLRIEDIAPLTLYLNGVPIPDDMDGQVRSDLLEATYRQVHPVHIGTTGPLGGPSPEADLSEAEREEIHRRLVDLGYLE
jgi:predicted AlkP superfamily phosphohydrolase/phosphomutase